MRSKSLISLWKTLTASSTFSICRIAICLSFLLQTTILTAQDSTANNTHITSAKVKTDSASKDKKAQREARRLRIAENHSPRTATLLAVALPGAGQLYNRKFWKAPIVWAGFGTLTYFIIKNDQDYHHARMTYNNWYDGRYEVIDGVEVTTRERARALKDYHRRYRDLSYFLSAALYALQIIDANVDAHLMDFRVSNDLLLSFHPHLEPSPSSASFGLSLTLTSR